MSYKHWDNLTPGERVAVNAEIHRRIPDIRATAVAKGWPQPCLENIEAEFDASLYPGHSRDAVVVNGEYLVLYDKVDSWWHSKPMLCDETILALRPGGNFAALLASIEKLAKAEGCGAVCLGTAAAPSNEAYTRLLTRHGYKALAYQLVKGI